jgi:hypothetical protein
LTILRKKKPINWNDEIEGTWNEKSRGITDIPLSFQYNGNLTCTQGKIGGWNLGSEKLSSDAKVGKPNSFHLGTTDFEGTVAGAKLQNWRLTIGENFGVDSMGKIYAKEAKIFGEITATSGKIGENGWNITEYGISTTLEGRESGLSSTLDASIESVSGLGRIRFYAGKTAEQPIYKAPFYVVDNGDVVGTNVRV